MDESGDDNLATNGGGVSDVEDDASNQGPQPVRVPVVMANFEDINTPDDPSVLAKLGSIKVTWDEDVKYFFFEIENQMEIINVTSQWIKRVILANNLPSTVKTEVKDVLKKTKNEAGATVYKDLKAKILKLFGRKEGENYERALQLTLHQGSKPSK